MMLTPMSEAEIKAVKRWREYQERKAPMIVLATPPTLEFHRAFIVVPQEENDFFMADFPSMADAKTWCAERGLPVVET